MKKNSDQNLLREILKKDQQYRWVYLIFFMFLLFLRNTGAFLTPQFFVEDGSIFFQQSFDYEWKSLLLPYAGYLHTLPRLTALVASVFPYEIQPAIFLSMTFLVILLVAYFISKIKQNLIDWRLALIGVAFVPVLSVIFFHTAAHMWFCWLFLFFLIIRSEDPKPSWSIYTFAALSSVTGPFIVVACLLYP